MSKRSCVLFFLSIFFIFPLTIQASSNDDCLACHEDAVYSQKFSTSVHKLNLCTSCHSDIQEVPHENKPKPATCANCHRIEAEVYRSSDHGIALKTTNETAYCLDCHGNPHTILSSRDAQSPTYRSNIPKTCAVCHENDRKMMKYTLAEKKPFKSYSESVHGKALLEKGLTSSAVCTDCHGSHDLHASSNPASKIYRTNVPNTCGRCHENVLQVYQRSVHGKGSLAGKKESPVCTDCHGEHTIKSHLDPSSSVYSTVISTKTCGQCHASERIVTKYRLPGDRLKTYLESYHGLADRHGVTTVANCASCHGAHDVLPSSDPSSSVNKANLPKTCGKCHPHAGAQLARGSIHLAPSPFRDQAVFFVKVFYIFLIIVTISGMLFHNTLDFFKKLKIHYQKKERERTYLRFMRAERIQHSILVVTFFTLAYTGFALKYPQAWWAIPFTILDISVDWRGLVHRAMAAVFIGLCIYHTLYIFFTKRGRLELKALTPKSKDLSDLFALTKWNLGVSQEKPKFERFNYIEKAEYWALVWGSVIMIVTGLVLTFENFIMRYLPKWLLDVATAIHFYEAVLATFAIIVWHFYFTILDPDCYPMNWSMITGKALEEEKRIGENLGPRQD